MWLYFVQNVCALKYETTIQPVWVRSSRTAALGAQNRQELVIMVNLAEDHLTL